MSFRLKKKTSGKWYSALEGGAFEPSADFCYALHVTGPAAELRRLPPPKVASCDTAPPGLGKVVGLFSKGETIEVDIPIGLDRRFDLFAYPKAMMPDGACAHAFRVDPPAAGSASQMQFFLDDAEFKGKAQLIASATVEIKEGVNDIDLVAAGDSAIGVPYGCDGLPTVTVEQPSAGATMSARTLGNYAAGGLCSEANEAVKVSVGSLEFEDTCDTNQTWSLYPIDLSSLADGTYIMKVRHRDLAGNWSATREVSFNKDSSYSFVRSSDPPSSSGVGVPFYSSLTVTFTDAAGPVSGGVFDGVPVTLQAYTDATCSTPGELLNSGSTVLLPASLSSGQATFVNVNYPEAEPEIYLQAAIPAGSGYSGFEGDCFGPIDVSGSGGHKFAFVSGVPSSPYTASAATHTIEVEYQDYFGTPEIITSGTHAVGFYTYTDATCPSGQGSKIAEQNLTVGNSSVTFSGIAFDDASVRAIGISFYQGSPPDAGAGVCLPFQVNADTGGTLKFAISGLPGAAVTAGSSNLPLVVNLQDSFGNPVNATGNISGIDVKTFSNSLCTTGEASFMSGLQMLDTTSSIPGLTGSVTVAAPHYFKVAAAGGVSESECAGPVNVNAGTAIGIELDTIPASGTAGSAFTISARIVDFYQNTVTSDTRSVTFTMHDYALSPQDCTTATNSFFKKSDGSAATAAAVGGVASISVKSTRADAFFIKASANSGAWTACSGNYTTTHINIAPSTATKLVALLPGESLSSGNSAGTGKIGSPSAQANYAPVTIGVKATDDFYNIVGLSGGGLSLTCQDPRAADYAGTGVFSSGSATLTAYPRDLGTWGCTVKLPSALGALSAGTSTTTANMTVSHVCSGAANGASAPFHAGTGGASSPFVICTEAELASLDNVAAGKYFVLAQDITLGSPWAPIGTYGSGFDFDGIFDGDNHKVSSLTVNGSGTNFQGFFAATAPTAIIENFHLVVESVTGQDHVGALVGHNEGVIRNSSVTIPAGKSVSGRTYVGGAVGTQYGGSITDTIVKESGVYGQVRASGASGTGAYQGGLVGALTEGGDLLRVGASVNVMCSEYASTCSDDSYKVGGLVGAVAQGGAATTSDISQAYFYGSVHGGNSVGGLVGYLSGSALTKSFAYTTAMSIGVVSGFNTGNIGKIGGLVGDVAAGAAIDEVYTQGDAQMAPLSGPNINRGSLFGSVVGGFACGSKKCIGHTQLHASYLAQNGTSVTNAQSISSFTSLTDFATALWIFTATNTYNGSGGVWMKDPYGPTSNGPVQQWVKNANADFSKDSAQTAEPITISFDGLRVAQAAATTTVRSQRSVADGSGSWYWEVTIHPSAVSNVSVGIVRAGSANVTWAPLQGLGFGSTGLDGWGYLSSGNKMHAQTSLTAQSYGSAYGPGDVVGVLLDATNRVLSFRLDSSAGTQAYAGSTHHLNASGSWVPAVGVGAVGQTFDVSVNFGTKPFKYGLPSGYKPFNYQN